MNDSDRRYLDLLSFFNYVLGGIHLFLMAVSLSLVIGSTLYSFQSLHIGDLGPSPLDDSAQVPYASPFSLGGLLLRYGLTIFLVGLAYALLTLASGRCLKRRKGYEFSFAVACLQCTFIPFGTILGIVTIIILLKDSVRMLYRLNQQ